MSELDWIQRSVLVIGSFISGCILILIGVMGQDMTIAGEIMSFPVVIPIINTTLGKEAFIGLGLLCMGVQTTVYKIQKRMILGIVKCIEG